MKNTQAYNLFILLSFLLILVGCSNSSKHLEPEAASREIITLLANEEYEYVYNDYLEENFQSAISLDEFVDNWKEKALGNYVKISSVATTKRGDSYHIVEAELEYSEVIFQLRLTLNKEYQVVGMLVSNVVVNVPFPATIVEEEVIIGEGTAYELGGTLTLPKGSQATFPAVVLVHGSGPSNRDEAAYAYRTFRDLAWGLAEQGIAVLRYDKRTYTHGKSLTPEQLKEITVYEETIEDAVRAGELLKQDSRIASDQVYLLGHSLGGMLAPRIDLEGDFAGIIILAGSPRPLWDIIYDQNMALVALGTLNIQQEQLIHAEYEKAKQLEKLTKEEALEETVFSIPAYYLKEMESYNTASISAELSKPVLVLQGEADFQVYYEKDFALWKELFHGKENAALISYPKLNHFFVAYQGPDEGTVLEYNTPGVVEEAVINDIAVWIMEQTS